MAFTRIVARANAAARRNFQLFNGADRRKSLYFAPLSPQYAE
jgi:hypothetical protein